MPYTAYPWSDLPAHTTPLDATNLNRMEAGIELGVTTAEDAAAAVATETTNRIADVNAEESARIAAVSAEASTRAAADTAEATARTSAVTAEATARTSADNALDARLDTLEGVTAYPPTGTAGGVLSGTYPNPGFAADMATQAELDAEATTRASADTALDSRLDVLETSGAAPSGAAGGVLSGTYPNPGFAVDMATQAELNAVQSALAAADTALDARLDILETGAITGLTGETGFSVDNNGDVIEPAESDVVRITAASMIVGSELVSDIAGDVSVEVWRATYAAYPTFTKISASAPMVLTAAQKAQPALTGWTTTLATGDYLKFIIIGTPTNMTRLTGTLKLART